MRLAGDEYYDGTSLADVRVVSTIGFDEAQIDALRDVEGVSAVMPLAKPTPFQNWMACNIRCAFSLLTSKLLRRARATMALPCNRATIRI